MHSDFYVLENAILQFTQLPEIQMNIIRGPEFQLSLNKGDQAVSVAACVKVNELSLSTPATCPPSQKSLGRGECFFAEEAGRCK